VSKVPFSGRKIAPIPSKRHLGATRGAVMHLVLGQAAKSDPMESLRHD
jgi:hypothetical protein